MTTVGDWRWVAGATVLVALSACAGVDGPSTVVATSVEPSTPVTAVGGLEGAVGSAPATAVPSPSRSASPSSRPSASASAPGRGRRAPTLADVAQYVADVQPAGVTRVDGVAEDLDGDGEVDVLLWGLRDGRGWVATATWDGAAYGLAAQDVGGPADRVDDLRLADITGDDVAEVVLEVSGEGSGSIALWSLPAPDRLVPLEARGGCNAGSHVYGAIGASLLRGADGMLEVEASCDDAPLPVADWGTQRYAWDGAAYVAG